MLHQAELNGNSSLILSLKHLGQTPEEQLQNNQAVRQLLKQWMEEHVTEEEEITRAEYFEKFKEIVDSTRMSKNKLYSPE